MKLNILIFTALFLSGCASLNQGLTPNPETIILDFDNSIEVIQKPVSSASSLGEGWHTLGFRWNSKNPKVVYLTAGTQGIVNITGLSFNIDGEIIDVKVASSLTSYDDWSTRQFVMSLSKFRKLANAKIVKMKVIMIDKYSVSSFGKQKQKAIVNGKFAKFLHQIDSQLSNK